jgi:hypothetical protein
MAGRFEILRRAADRLEVELAGELGERTLVQCEAEIRTQLSVIKSGGVKVLVDLVAVKGYSLEARDVLVTLQRFLGSKASQTAFIADSPSSRSLALWLAHMTQGQVIKSFGRREDALAWLAGSVGPVTGVRPVHRAREATAIPRRRKRTAG